MVLNKKLKFIPLSYNAGQVFNYEVKTSVTGKKFKINNQEIL